MQHAARCSRLCRQQPCADERRRHSRFGERRRGEWDVRGLYDRGMPATSGASIREVLRFLPARPLMGVPRQTHAERTGGGRAASATIPTAPCATDGRYARRARAR